MLSQVSWLGENTGKFSLIEREHRVGLERRRHLVGLRHVHVQPLGAAAGGCARAPAGLRRPSSSRRSLAVQAPSGRRPPRPPRVRAARRRRRVRQETMRASTCFSLKSTTASSTTDHTAVGAGDANYRDSGLGIRDSRDSGFAGFADPGPAYRASDDGGPRKAEGGGTGLSGHCSSTVATWTGVTRVGAPGVTGVSSRGPTRSHAQTGHFDSGSDAGLVEPGSGTV